jgi:hypothetical protein
VVKLVYAPSKNALHVVAAELEVVAESLASVEERHQRGHVDPGTKHIHLLLQACMLGDNFVLLRFSCRQSSKGSTWGRSPFVAPCLVFSLDKVVANEKRQSQLSSPSKTKEDNPHPRTADEVHHLAGSPGTSVLIVLVTCA